MEEILSFAYMYTHEKTSPVSLKLYPGIVGFCRALEVSKVKKYYLKYSEVGKTDT